MKWSASISLLIRDKKTRFYNMLLPAFAERILRQLPYAFASHMVISYNVLTYGVINATYFPNYPQIKLLIFLPLHSFYHYHTQLLLDFLIV